MRGDTPASEPEARLLENYDGFLMDLRTGAPVVFWQGRKRAVARNAGLI